MEDAQRAMMAQSLGGDTQVIRRGSRGDDVAQIQQFLAARGYDVGAVDGVFGRRTEEAVRQFQMEAGIAQDGRVGPETMTAAQRVSDAPPIPVMRDDPMGSPVEAPSGNPPNPGIAPDMAMDQAPGVPMAQEPQQSGPTPEQRQMAIQSLTERLPDVDPTAEMDKYRQSQRMEGAFGPDAVRTSPEVDPRYLGLGELSDEDKARMARAIMGRGVTAAR